MKHPGRRWIVLALVCVLASCRAPADGAAGSAGAQAPGSDPAPAAPVAVGQRPTLQVATLDGQPYDLAAQRGKWVVVNYWATWCGPCIKEMPELSALHAMRDHVEVIGLAYEDASVDELRTFLAKHPVTYPVARIDPAAPPAAFGDAAALPMTWLIAPDGRLVKRFIGPITAQAIEQAIAAAGGPTPGPA